MTSHRAVRNGVKDGAATLGQLDVKESVRCRDLEAEAAELRECLREALRTQHAALHSEEQGSNSGRAEQMEEETMRLRGQLEHEAQLCRLELKRQQSESLAVLCEAAEVGELNGELGARVATLELAEASLRHDEREARAAQAELEAELRHSRAEEGVLRGCLLRTSTESAEWRTAEARSVSEAASFCQRLQSVQRNAEEAVAHAQGEVRRVNEERAAQSERWRQNLVCLPLRQESPHDDEHVDKKQTARNRALTPPLPASVHGPRELDRYRALPVLARPSPVRDVQAIPSPDRRLQWGETLEHLKALQSSRAGSESLPSVPPLPCGEARTAESTATRPQGVDISSSASRSLDASLASQSTTLMERLQEEAFVARQERSRLRNESAALLESSLEIADAEEDSGEAAGRLDALAERRRAIAGRDRSLTLALSQVQDALLSDRGGESTEVQRQCRAEALPEMAQIGGPEISASCRPGRPSAKSVSFSE